MSIDVGIIMGSVSDWDTMRHAADTLEQLGIPHEVQVVSAHRTPDKLFTYAEQAAGRGLERRGRAKPSTLPAADWAA